MTRALRSVVAAIALSVVGMSTAAHAVTVPAGDILRVTFAESSPPRVKTGGGTVITSASGAFIDTMTFFSIASSLVAHGTARLYDGTTLLATMNLLVDGVRVFAFASPTATFSSSTSDIGILNDWSTIEDGTIDGVLDITLDRTTSLSVIVMGIGIGNGTDSFFTGAPNPVITGQSVVSAVAATPLPAALPLFAGGLGLLGLVAGRRRRKA
jgi:hypothetical protein